jgi:hypothetical protein
VDNVIDFLLNTVSEMFTYREVRRHFCALSDSSGMLHTRSDAKYWTTLIMAPAHISMLNDVFAWFIVPLIAVGRF